MVQLLLVTVQLLLVTLLVHCTVTLGQVQILLLVLEIVQLFLVMVLVHCTGTLGHGTNTFTTFRNSTITLQLLLVMVKLFLHIICSFQDNTFFIMWDCTQNKTKEEEKRKKKKRWKKKQNRNQIATSWDVQLLYTAVMFKVPVLVSSRGDPVQLTG